MFAHDPEKKSELVPEQTAGEDCWQGGQQLGVDYDLAQHPQHLNRSARV